jgi:DNA-directed RNA polymerase I, II, and III subunit RPABC2
MDTEAITYKIEPEEEENDEDASSVESNVSDIISRIQPKIEGQDDDEDEIDASDVENEDGDVDLEDDDASDVEDDDEDDIDIENFTNEKKTKSAAPILNATSDNEEEEDDDEDDDENYLQKFDEKIRQNIIGDWHPEMIQHNDEEVETLSKIVRDSDGVIIDPFHKTLPFVTKYERARILGERAKQINSGAKPFIKVEKTIIDGYLIALKEFEEKKIPFIVRRPLPNGCSEYWKFADLQILE